MVTWNLARSFAKGHHKVTIITTSIPGKDSEFFEEAIHVIPLEGTLSGKYSLNWWHSTKKYLEKATIEKDSVILSVSTGGLSLLSLKKKINIPFILQAHGTSRGEILSKWRDPSIVNFIKSIRNLIYLFLEIFLIPKFDSVITIGPRVDLDIKKFPYIIPIKRIIQIKNGINDELFLPANEKNMFFRKKYSIDENVKIITTISRLHTQKGINNTIFSFHHYHKKNKNSMMLIAGDGPQRKEIEGLIQELDLKEKVILLGNLDQNYVSTLLQDSNLFLFLTEHTEGLPTNILEALSTGLKCIVSEHLLLPKSKQIFKTNPKDHRKTAYIIENILNINSDERDFPPEFTLKYSSKSYIEEFEYLLRIKFDHKYI